MNAVLTSILGLLLFATSAQADGRFMKLALEKKDLWATLTTTQGEIVVHLLSKETPKTVANFVGLAEGEKESRDENGKPQTKRLYDNTIFHRVIPNFMIQGGDPTSTGRGQPVTPFEDEFASHHGFDKVGLLAMANRGPNTNGSQFFITVSMPTYLNGKHTIFGEVISGYDVVTAISTVKTSRLPKDRPIDDVKLIKVSISDKAPKVKKVTAK